MAKYPSLPLFTDAFIADTTHLSAAQTGAYLMLLMCAWRSPDAKLPDDDRQLSRFARMDLRTWRQNKDVVMSFWKHDEQGKWYQRRLLDERKYVDDLSSKNSEAGRSSALKRKGRHSTSVATEFKPKFNPHTHTHTKIEDIESSILDKTRFDEFWRSYPKQRKGNRQKAQSAYKNALTRATEEEIHEGLSAYIRSSEVKGGFAKGAAAWLNDDRWSVEYDQGNRSSGRPTKTDRAREALIRSSQALGFAGEPAGSENACKSNLSVFSGTETIREGARGAGEHKPTVSIGFSRLPDSEN